MPYRQLAPLLNIILYNSKPYLSCFVNSLTQTHFYVKMPPSQRIAAFYFQFFQATSHLYLTTLYSGIRGSRMGTVVL